MSPVLRSSIVPPELPENIVICPTMNRWGNGNGEAGHLPRMVRSVEELVQRDDIGHTTALLIADASGQHGAAMRAARLAQVMEGIPSAAPVYLLTPELQGQVLDTLHERTGIERRILHVLLTHTGYASQRQKLDLLLAGVVGINGKPLRVASFDDDTILPAKYGIVRPDVLSSYGMSAVPNSQILLGDHDASKPEVFQYANNDLRDVFGTLGKTVGALRRIDPLLRVTRLQQDTMNEALQAAAGGSNAQFVVTASAEDDLSGAGDARVIAVAGTKFGIPDYRTVSIARAHLLRAFPDKEVEVQSALSGPLQKFGFQVSLTNVDSAAMGRFFDERTSKIPWWFVSNDAISRENPLQTVTGHYRSDNEFLPLLMEKISDAWGELHIYVSGMRTQIFHNRARTGYRPNLPTEQAPASLVGNVAATQTLARLLLARDGTATIEGVGDDYEVPDELARRVFDQLYELARICEDRLNAGAQEPARGQYAWVYNTLKAKLADFTFAAFHAAMSVEVRDQIRFFGTVMEAYPHVIDAVNKLIAEGRYPVLEFSYVDAEKVFVEGHVPRNHRDGVKEYTPDLGAASIQPHAL